MSIEPGATVIKDPDAELLYTFDWSSWLVSPAQIASSTFTISGGGGDGALTKDNETDTGTTASVRLIGGTLGRTYTLSCRIVTDESPTQTDDRSIYVKIAAQ